MLDTLIVVLWVFFGLFSTILFLTFYYRDLQNKLLYMNEQPPDARKVIDVTYNDTTEPLTILTRDGIKLDAYVVRYDLPANGEHCHDNRLLIHFHGNAGNIGHRLPLARAFSRSLRCDVLMVDYRGYGRSEGTPSEEGLQEDALATLRAAVRVAKNPESIFVHGSSLGAAVSIFLASRSNVAEHISGLIVRSPTWSACCSTGCLRPEQTISSRRFSMLC
eukprot:PhM_4_TR8251/c0_g1_i1/m.49341/K06889/K06889; uncharacterized protein